MDSALESVISVICMAMCCGSIVLLVMSATAVRFLGRMLGSGTQRGKRMFKSEMDFGFGDATDDVADFVSRFLK